VAQFRTAAVDAPRLEREIGPLTFSGRVLAIETQARGVRLLLDRLEGARLARAGRVPERVRISLRTGGEGVSPGDRLTVLAVLQPPPAPSFPGG
ncbi:MAG: ComEC family competence protein, partial [Alphaproteobacteria bacterium]